MNYRRLYDSLIHQAIKADRLRFSCKDPRYVYYENHHIKPKCLGGTNDRKNMVLLTAREHFLAHWLLYKLHPENIKLALAFSRCRSTSSKNKKNNSRLYKYAKEALAKANSERKWTDKSKEGIRFSNSHRVCTDHTRSLRSQNMKGNTHTLGHKLTESHKIKISIWSKNMPEEQRRKQRDSYIRRKTEKKFCEYCGKEVTLASYDKAHGIRCKLNPNCIRKSYDHVCVNCGCTFSSFSKNRKYCSEKCKRNFYSNER